jgi:hypothetical protein
MTFQQKEKKGVIRTGCQNKLGAMRPSVLLWVSLFGLGPLEAYRRSSARIRVTLPLSGR